MMSVTTIILADDHHVVRQSLRLLLETEPGYQVLGEASTGLEAVELVERLRPNVLVTDIMMPGLNGIDVARRVRKQVPATIIVILSMYENEAYVVEALRAGVSAYVLKKSTAQELVFALRQAVAGNLFLSPPLTEHAIRAYMEKMQGITLDPYETLTAREREVLHLAAEGLNNTEVAVRLSISPRTAEMHHGNLMRKLHLRNQTELIRFALQRGILPLED
jgi:two-component system, NarL family, response regulator NreC